MSGVPCCLVEVFLLNKELAAISHWLLWVVEGGYASCILTKPVSVALVFLFALLLVTMHVIVKILWHGYLSYWYDFEIKIFQCFQKFFFRLENLFVNTIVCS